MSADRNTGKKSVLFICLGNICRSPIAEAVFRHLIKQRNVGDEWTVDSAAVMGYHIGKNPDRRARDILKERNIEYSHKVRVLCEDDFKKFQTIFGMDDENIQDINSAKPKGSKVKVQLLGEYSPQNERIIRDPYYDGGDEGFRKVYEQCLQCCNAFLDENS
ncbi:primo-1 (predicted) [Pycnogonum litorale]